MLPKQQQQQKWLGSAQAHTYGRLAVITKKNEMKWIARMRRGETQNCRFYFYNVKIWNVQSLLSPLSPLIGHFHSI